MAFVERDDGIFSFFFFCVYFISFVVYIFIDNTKISLKDVCFNIICKCYYNLMTEYFVVNLNFQNSILIFFYRNS